MFRRHHCYYSCYHHHTWLSFSRGMVSMFILAFVVLGILHYPEGPSPPSGRYSPQPQPQPQPPRRPPA